MWLQMTNVRLAGSNLLHGIELLGTAVALTYLAAPPLTNAVSAGCAVAGGAPR